MIDERYADYLRLLEVAMVRARELGLYRTMEKVHLALNEARAEQYEVSPTTNPVTVSLTIGPVREQP